MYNLFFKILIFIIIVSTLGILGLKPKMHKRIFVLDSSYSIVDDDEADTNEIVSKEETTVIAQKTTSNEVKKEVQKKEIAPKKVALEKKVVSQPKQEVKQSAKPAVTSVKQAQVTVQKQPEKIAVATKTSEPRTNGVKKVESTKQVQPQNRVLTEQEEEIAWNIWHSNLQNQIMKDTKLPYIPKGTIFKFSFDVDKYGRISSIKTYSTNPNYTPYAIQYIAPVIRSYQGKDILEFPTGTQRLTTTFTGGWKMSDSAKYSTPNDYNDIEKVKK